MKITNRMYARRLLRCAAGLAVGTTLVATTAFAQQANTFTSEVKVKSLDVKPGIGEPGNLPGRAPRFELPAGIDIAKLPGKMPEYTPPKQRAEVGKGSFLLHDCVTQQTASVADSQIPAQIRDADAQLGSANDEGGEGFSDRNFTTLTYNSTPAAWPYNMNVKLVMEWRRSDGGYDYYVASGSMIDATHVLTAGHCVWDSTYPGGWANRIWVYPGYENGNKPVGEAVSGSLWAWSGWTSGGDFRYDMAGIILNRPIGALTGWFGYGFTTDCGFFTGNYFNNYGYPAEGAMGYNGEYQYYHYGWFDSCPDTNLVQMNKLIPKGMSGSGAYFIDGSSNRYDYAVCSHRYNASGISRYVNMWSSMFYYIRDTRIPSDTPDTVDFIPLWVKSPDYAVNAGYQLSNFSHYIHNNSEQSYCDYVYWDVRLSTNDTISTGDTAIGSYYGYFCGGPKSTGSWSYGGVSPTIPANTPSGWYYLGINVTTSDSNNSNNTSNGQDAYPIYVYGHPDINHYYCDAAGTYRPGQNVDVAYYLYNQGGDASPGYTVYVYGAPEGGAYTFLGSQAVSNTVYPSSYDSGTVSVPLPGGLSSGNYYIATVIYSGATEIDYGNNTYYDGSPITINADSCPSDYNGDGFVTGDDFDAYVDDFYVGNPRADFNGDGFVTGDDYDAYVDAFYGGC